MYLRTNLVGTLGRGTLSHRQRRRPRRGTLSVVGADNTPRHREVQER